MDHVSSLLEQSLKNPDAMPRASLAITENVGLDSTSSESSDYTDRGGTLHSME